MFEFHDEAKEFKNIKGWINSDSLTMFQLRKKVVLLDFWTYSCVNCIRSIPHLKELHKKYADNGLIIIGVHTPEFRFEKNPENVEAAVKKWGIEYPVALDSENTTWQIYGNKYWPRQTLIDARGSIRLEHVGEGGYEELEEKIAELLAEIGVKDLVIYRKKEKQKDRFKTFRAQKGLTPEIYVGAERSNGFGNSQVCVPGSCIRFIDRGDHKPNTVYLGGDWTQKTEKIHHPTEEEAHVALNYTAKSVNVVMAPDTESRFRVFVFLDGKPIERKNAGRDILIKAGKSYFEVDKADMYEIIDTGTMQNHEVKLVSDSPEVALYTFTFG